MNISNQRKLRGRKLLSGELATYLTGREEETTIEREFSVLEAIDDNFPKMVISMDKVNRSRNGIEHKNIIDFLLEG